MTDQSEEAIQQLIRLEASNLGVPMWRNNVGACFDDRGVMIRYGLANDSAKINKVLKSSDLIGVTPMLITQEMVGCIAGIFTAVEVKHGGWNPNKKLDDHETAQKNYLDTVHNAGGLAGFANSVEAFRRIIKQ